MKKLIFCLFLMPVAAFSQSPQAYECNITGKAGGGWIGDVYYLSFAGDMVGIYDWATHEAYEAPVTTKLTEVTDELYRFNWTVKGIKGSGGEGRHIVDYRARFYRDRNILSVMGKLRGYDNHIGGRATCKKLKK